MMSFRPTINGAKFDQFLVNLAKIHLVDDPVGILLPDSLCLKNRGSQQ